MATTAQLEQRLQEAEQAYHDLSVGDMAKVFVDQNGERIEYQSANSSKLAAYIRQLEFQLGRGAPLRPMGMYVR